MKFHKQSAFCSMVMFLSILASLGCGSGSNPSAGNFAARPSTTPIAATSTGATLVQLASIVLSPTTVVGGSSVQIRVALTASAPTGGAVIELGSSDPSILRTPATINIPAGLASATATASTTAVIASTKVAVAAIYNDLLKGTSVTVVSAVSPTFSLTLQPSTFTIGPGQTGAVSVITGVTTGYNHAIQLRISQEPAGISGTLSNSVIAAPGTGNAKLDFSVGNSVGAGSYSMVVMATDGTTTRSATLTLKVGTNPGATFQGCWYQQNGHRYQGARISVDTPGTYPFDAVLYYGSSCSASNFADEFGFGIPINFGSYIFWFRDFADQSDTSAIWHVGSNQSQCVNYAMAPAC